MRGLNEGLKSLLEVIKVTSGVKAKDLSPRLNGRSIKTIERQIKAIKLIKEKRAISLSDIQVFYVTTTRKTLYRDLQNLVDKGLVKAQGDRKGRKYAL
ncbi:MAG: hypothetical protein KKC39_04365 [Candidatus Omnitrophica bacterium]|nr:hypothetical protein [Candidatus Omnitrophota bacterium]